MLYPRLTNSDECGSIHSLIANIDCRLEQLAVSMYNNIIYSLNKPVSITDAFLLSQYRRILLTKLINPDYVSSVCFDKIVSRVKKLTLGCKTKCACNTVNVYLTSPIFIPPQEVTTTTTTTYDDIYTTYTYYTRIVGCYDCTVSNVSEGYIYNRYELKIGDYYQTLDGLAQIIEFDAMSYQNYVEELEYSAGSPSCTDTCLPGSLISDSWAPNEYAACQLPAPVTPIYCADVMIGLDSKLCYDSKLTIPYFGSPGQYKKFYNQSTLSEQIITLNSYGKITSITYCAN